MPIPRSLGSDQVTFLSEIQISPSMISIRPAMAFRRVDLPQPDGPRRTTNSPRPTSRSSFSITLTAPNSIARSLIATDVCMSLSLDGASGDAAHEPASGEEVAQQRHGGGQNGRG